MRAVPDDQDRRADFLGHGDAIKGNTSQDGHQALLKERLFQRVSDIIVLYAEKVLARAENATHESPGQSALPARFDRLTEIIVDGQR